MAELGRILVDRVGVIREVDDAFCATMKSAADRLIGRNVLELTAAADRDRCAVLLARLIADHQPVSTVKRMVRANGTHIWVQKTLHYIASADGVPACEAFMVDAVPPSDWVDPSRLLHVARFILASRRAREQAFSAHFFGDPAWDIMLMAYVSEAEGRLLSTATIHATIGITLANASRWIRALNAEELIEYEASGSSKALVTSPIRLSASGHRRLEQFLTGLHQASVLDQEMEFRSLR